MTRPEPLARVPLSSVEATLGWLTEVLPSFDPLPSGVPNQVNLKAFAELSITFLYLSEHAAKLREVPPYLSNFLRVCSTHLKLHCSRAEYIDAVRRDPLNAYTFVLPYLALRCLKFRWPPFESFLDWLVQLSLPLSVEVVPYRELDRLHFLHKSKLLARTPKLDLLFRSTTLARRNNSIYYSELDAYAVTHTIFYLTDFGQRAPSLSARQTAETGVLLQSLLVHFWRIKNWDVMGELIICTNYLKIPRDPVLADASAAFEQLLRPDGTVPARQAHGPRGVGRRRAQGSGATISDYLRGCYHTTFVWILYVLSTASHYA